MERFAAGAEQVGAERIKRCRPKTTASSGISFRFNEPRGPKAGPALADAQGPVHALHGAGLPHRLSRSRRHRPVRERHRRRQLRRLHRLRAAARPVVRSTCRASQAKTGKMAEVHAVRGPGVGRHRAGLHQGLPDRLPAVRHQGGHARARRHARRAAQGQRLRAGRALRSAGRVRHQRGDRARRSPTSRSGTSCRRIRRCRSRCTINKSVLKPVGLVAIFATIGATALHFLRFGPKVERARLPSDRRRRGPAHAGADGRGAREPGGRRATSSATAWPRA